MRALIEEESLKHGDESFRARQLDFILYVGDDGQTEQVFKYLNRIQTKQRRLLQQKLHTRNGSQPVQQVKASTAVSPDI